MSEKAIINPEDFVKYIARARGIGEEELRIPRFVIASFIRRPLEKLVEITGAKGKDQWLYASRPLYVGSVDGLPIAIMFTGWGSPVAAWIAEEMIACGADTLLALGACGSLQTYVGIGDIITPSKALIDEGTSRHYLPGITSSKADGQMVRSLRQACEDIGARYHVRTIWTTDAPYRETVARVRRLRGQGVLGVDCETSSLFTIAAFRGVRAGSLLVVSDSLARLRWEPELRSPEYRKALDRAVPIALNAIRRLTGAN